MFIRQLTFHSHCFYPHRFRPVDTRLRPGQNRFLEAEEEEYFNAEDDEDDSVLPSISQQSRIPTFTSAPANTPTSVLSPDKMINSNPNINLLKRKRREVGGSVGRTHRPPLRPPVMRPLVDYGEDEDEDVGFPSDATIKMESDRPGSTGLTGSGPKLAPSPIPSTAGLTLGGGPPRRVPKKEDEDDEDAILESLVRGQTPAPPGWRPAPVPRMASPPRLGEKRRRGNGGGDDDDDELFSRLTRNKKQQVFVPVTASRQQQQQQSKTGFMAIDSAASRQKNGSDPLKKFKVKIGGFVTARTAQTYSGSTAAASENVLTPSSPSPAPSVSASPSPAPSDSNTKDGDTG